MAGLSRSVLWLAEKQPSLMRAAVRLWLNAHVARARGGPRAPHWLLLETANRLRYRLPVKATLGNGQRIWVPLNDLIGETIYKSGYYEPDWVAIIQRLLEPGMVFFDVGAHIGQYTLLASEAVGSEGQVHSFEPDPDTYWFLDASVRLNRLRNVKSHCVALSSEPGTKSLYLAPVSSLGDSSLAPPKGYVGVTRTVPCTSLDAYVATHRVPRVDLIKVAFVGRLVPYKGADMLIDATAPLVRAGKIVVDIIGDGPEMGALRQMVERMGLSGAVTLAGSLSVALENARLFEETRQRAFGTSCRLLAEALRAHGYTLLTGAGAHWHSYTPSPADPASLNVLAVPEHRRDAVLGALKELASPASIA